MAATTQGTDDRRGDWDLVSHRQLDRDHHAHGRNRRGYSLFRCHDRQPLQPKQPLRFGLALALPNARHCTGQRLRCGARHRRGVPHLRPRRTDRGDYHCTCHDGPTSAGGILAKYRYGPTSDSVSNGLALLNSDPMSTFLTSLMAAMPAEGRLYLARYRAQTCTMQGQAASPPRQNLHRGRQRPLGSHRASARRHEQTSQALNGSRNDCSHARRPGGTIPTRTLLH